MEAALRTAVHLMDPSAPFSKLEFEEVRGLQGVKEATYQIAGKTVKVAVVNGLSNAKSVCDKVKRGEADYQFIEVMTCPGGCVMGGGQPIRATFVKHKDEVAVSRASVLYNADKAMYTRRSHNNGSVTDIYNTYLGAPNSETAHRLLHTHYCPRPKYETEQ